MFPQGFQVWRIDLAPANRSFSSCSIPANAMHDGLYDTNPLQLERHGLLCSTIFARLCREVNVCNVRRLALCSDYIILNFLRLTALQCLIFVPHIFDECSCGLCRANTWHDDSTRRHCCPYNLQELAPCKLWWCSYWSTGTEYYGPGSRLIRKSVGAVEGFTLAPP